MAQKRHLTQYDSSGNKREIYLNDDEVLLEGGQTLKDRLAEMQEDIDDAGGQETDPTVPDWAKHPVKPTYTPQEVGAVPSQGYVEYTQAEKEKLGALPNASELSTQLGEKANADDVYDKQTVDQKVANAGKVKSVSVNDEDPVQPDKNGNVHLEIEGGEGKSAYQSYLDTTTDNPKKTEAEWVASLKGQKGDTGNVVVSDGVAQIGIINDLETGGEGDALSAGMGKRVAGREATDRQRIDAIVDILKKAVFTDDVSDDLDDLDAMAPTSPTQTDSISLDKSTYLFNGVGGTLQLNASTDPAGKAITWSSSDPSIASVNNGLVTAVAVGTVTITATSNGKTATCAITVQAFQVDSVSIQEGNIASNGETEGTTHALTAVTDPVGGSVSWSSNNSSVATVNASTGVVTIVGNGTATITATSGNVSDSITVTVANIVHLYDVDVVALSNVTLAMVDGNSQTVNDGDTIEAGSALTIKFLPAASHEISSLSVVMGSTTLSLSDATDGTDGAKVISIQSVSGDITVSASATYVKTNIIANATKLTGQGVIYSSGGNFGSHQNYDCFIVPLEFGKRYEVDGYDWKAKGGVSGGFNIALVKSDGNGGFMNINSDTDIADSAAFNTANTIFKIDGSKVYCDFGDSDYRERFIVTIPPASVFDQSVDAVYLAINTRFSGVDISNDIRMYEYLLGSEYSADDIILNYGPLYHLGYSIGFNSQYSVSIVKAVKGATYSYGGMKWSELNGNGAGFCVALLKKIGDTEMIDNLKAADFKNGSSWLQSDSYFQHTNNICKSSPAEAATITIPTSADLANDTDLYIAITTRFTSTDISSYITLTKQ